MPRKTPTTPVAASAGSPSFNVHATPPPAKRRRTSLTTDGQPSSGYASQEQTPTQQTAPQPNRWTVVGSGHKAAASRALSRLAPSTAARSTYNRSNYGAPQSNVPGRSQLSQMNMGGTGPAFYDPSMGPSRPVTTNNRHIAQSQASNASQQQSANVPLSFISGYTRHDFKRGYIISLPYHTPSTNPNIVATDNRLRLTCEGPAYSKRRMMVVMWVFGEDLFCLPLYSFTGKGIRGKPYNLRDEYVAVKNVGDENFHTSGNYPAVEASVRRPMTPATCVHLTGAMKVNCQEDIAHVGRLTEDSHRHLVGLWQALNRKAQQEAW